MYWLNGLNTSHRLCQGLEMWHCALPGMAFGRSSPDLSGHNRNAVSVTDVSHWSSMYTPPGVSYGQSLWSPVGTRMTVAGTGGFRPASCTLIASVKLTSASNQVTLSNRSGVTYTGLLMYFTGATLAILGSTSGGWWEMLVTGGIALGTLWHRCAVTYDAATGTARTYIDSKQDLAVTITPASLVWEAADWHVYSEPAVPFTGFQHDSKVYSRALSAAEIREEYIESLTGNRRLFLPSSVARQSVTEIPVGSLLLQDATELLLEDGTSLLLEAALTPRVQLRHDGVGGPQYTITAKTPAATGNRRRRFLVASS